MSPEEFQQIVDQTLNELPDEFKKAMENVGIVIEQWPTVEDYHVVRAHPRSLLFGLYRGVPKTKRLSSYSALPDKIVIFSGPILMISQNLKAAKEKIKDTVLHELGHHFGLSDDQIYRAKRG